MLINFCVTKLHSFETGQTNSLQRKCIVKTNFSLQLQNPKILKYPLTQMMTL